MAETSHGVPKMFTVDVRLVKNIVGPDQTPHIMHIMFVYVCDNVFCVVVCMCFA